MKFTQLSVLAVLAIAAQGAFAQAPVPPSSTSGSSSGSPSGSTQGGTGAATDASAVTNVGSAFASDSTIDQTTTTTTTDAIPTGEMANTGGEPELMLLAGVMLASGGLLLRRKTGSQSL